MSGSLVGIALTGLNSAQGGLVTTGHNISNVNTPGYSRQQAVQATNLAQGSGSGYFGRGSNIEDVRRSYDEFLTMQTRSAQASAAHWDTALSQLQPVDSLLADDAVGLNSVLAGFFGGVQAVAVNPSDVAARQSMLSAGQSLAGRVRDLSDHLDVLRSNTDQQIESTVTSVNSLASRIAELNDRIALASGIGTAGGIIHAPNDLLDQRDSLLSDLNKLVRANSVEQDDGTLNVFLATGQALVVGTLANTLKTASDSLDPEKLAVGVKTGNQLLTFRTADLEGGALGGLVAFREGTLDTARNALGRIAMVLANSFNQQNKLGLDRTGQYGGDFFAAGSPQVNTATTNSGSAQLSAAVADYSALTTSNYRVQYDGSNWNVTRLSDANVTSFATLPQTVDGVTISVASGAAAAGDSFLVLPTRNGAAGFAALLTNPDRIAAAAPIRTAASGTNTGSATVSAGQANGPVANANLQQNVTITFTGPGTFDVSGTGTGNPAGVSYTPGAPITYNGWTIMIDGTPASGDTFTVSANTGGTGDSRNALLLANLQTGTLVEGNATLDQAYGRLVSEVGNATHEADISATAQKRLLTEVQARQQSVSGVNLDEEAANLLRYQQAYQAAGKLVSIANVLFDTLLNLRN
jgi:flagellar hook-associated protein 1 FlgK